MKPRSCFRLLALSWLFFVLTARAEPSGEQDGPVSEAVDLHVDVNGDDQGSGTSEEPFATLEKALEAARKARMRGKGAVTIWVGDGTHYLARPLAITPADSGTEMAPLVIRATRGASPFISGGRRLHVEWKKTGREGVLRAPVPEGLESDQLFVNGERQHMARYPDFNPAVRHFNGYAKDAFSKERASRWAEPTGGYMHAMHRHLWGDFHYVIRGKKPGGELQYEGGWQNNRRYGMHGTYRMVENIFEELDAPGEWYLAKRERMLYFYPPEAVTMSSAVVEVVRLRHLFEVRGSEESPVRWVRFEGLRFGHTARTFMENKEPLLRSDWTTYRGGAVLIEGAEDCVVQDCEFDQVGGNAIFVNRYARRIAVRGCHIHHAGANGVAFVGDPAAVRSPLFEYSERQNYADVEKEKGPRTRNYPRDCTVEDCLIYLTGRVEKQTSAVQISMSRGITLRHLSIYDMPRAGINISEGTWGGHLIEYCDVFDTVKETGDHGSFNSWGRDRFWGLKDLDLNDEDNWKSHSQAPLLDALDQSVIRFNRWRCDHGWDIDLDDGSTNYHIYKNLCLRGGIKLREGFYRICENNIMVGNSFHPHVWYRYSQDIFRRNIVFSEYRPIRVPKPWGKINDYNLWHQSGAEVKSATKLTEQSGRDSHSIMGDAMFVDPTTGDYRVKPGSPAATKLGFESFPMDRFGVVRPSLRAIARSPILPGAKGKAAVLVEDKGRRGDRKIKEWFNASARNVDGQGDRSAYGLDGEYGVILLSVPEGSVAAGIGLQKNDVIVGLEGERISSLSDLRARFSKLVPGAKPRLEIVRSQLRKTLQFDVPPAK